MDRLTPGDTSDIAKPDIRGIGDTADARKKRAKKAAAQALAAHLRHFPARNSGVRPSPHLPPRK